MAARIAPEEEMTGRTAAADTAASNSSSSGATGVLPKAIDCVLPPGVAIRANAYGHGLFATRDFEAGALLYLTSCLYVPDVMGTVLLRVKGEGGEHEEEYTLDMEQHSVVQSDTGLRQLYTFDAFMNHACAPNTVSVVTGCSAETLEYGMKALRPIKAGEELTCDYNLFEYEAGTAAILGCQCGAPEGGCLGQIKGFKYLPFAHAAPRFALAEPYVLSSYLQDNPDIAFVDLRATAAAAEAIAMDMGMPAQHTPLDDTTQRRGPRASCLAKRAFAAGEAVWEPLVLQTALHADITRVARVVVAGPTAAAGRVSFGVSLSSPEEAESGGVASLLSRALFSSGSGGGVNGNVRIEGVSGDGKGTEEDEGDASLTTRRYRLVATAAIDAGQALVL